MNYFKIEIPGFHLQVQAYAWTPQKPLAVVQIAHGMQEHARRYDHFASWLNDHGIAVYANDHIGHGLTAKDTSDLGHFSRKDDWHRSVEILHNLTGKIRLAHPGIPVILLGHSMGSVLVQTYMMKYGKTADAYILSGAIRQPALVSRFGILLTTLLSVFFGPSDRSRLTIAFGYGRYNRYFRPNRTEIDWLCRSEKIVDEYIDSPLCGMPLTNRFYKNLSGGFLFITKKANLAQIPGGTRVLIAAGGQDPAGFFGKAPKIIWDRLTGISKADVTLKLYPGARHEVLNETNREEVYKDLLEWVKEKIVVSHQSSVISQ